jgi:hypothetical protein
MPAGEFVAAIIALAEVDDELVTLDLTIFNVPHIDSDVPRETTDLAQHAWARYLSEGSGEVELLLASLRLNPPGDVEGLDEIITGE